MSDRSRGGSSTGLPGRCGLSIDAGANAWCKIFGRPKIFRTPNDSTAATGSSVPCTASRDRGRAAPNPRFASARPIAEVSVFSRQATVLTSPSPGRSAAQPVADGRRPQVER